MLLCKFWSKALSFHHLKGYFLSPFPRVLRALPDPEAQVDPLELMDHKAQSEGLEIQGPLVKR